MKKRFLITQIILVIMLGVNLVGFTYSWSQRSAVKGGYQRTPMTLTYESKINGNQCTGATYQGTLDAASGEIIYSETSINSLSRTSVEAGTVLYFRTDITNAAAVATNVSLFTDIKYSEDLESKYFVGTLTPTVERYTYPAQDSELEDEVINTVKWLPVVNQYEVPAGANDAVNAYIEWYVEFEAAGNFEISKIVLTNN